MSDSVAEDPDEAAPDGTAFDGAAPQGSAADGTDSAAARLEAALERIANAAQAAPRAGEPRDSATDAVAARLDTLISELRTALSSTEA